MNGGNIFELFQVEKGATPLPKISEEATSLIVASHSVLFSLAMQGAPISPRLINALDSFMKANIGFQVTFDQLAALDNQKPERQSIEGWATDLARAVESHAGSIAKLNQADAKDFARILASLGRIQLLLNSLASLYGWSESDVRLASRLDYDKRHP